jgi:hypothetical protein
VARPIDLQDPASVRDLFGAAADALRSAPFRRGSVVRLPARGRLVVTGDLHDSPRHLAATLAVARLGQAVDHHEVLHEIIHGGNLVNGMDFSHRTLARVAGLVLERPGQVHPLLANHELAQMLGLGVSKGAGNSVEHFNEALAYAFADAWPGVAEAITAFIAALPLALVTDGGLLCAHSLPDAAAMTRFDPGILERDLEPDDYVPPAGSAYLMVWGRRHRPDQLETLAARWQARLFCLGHQRVATGIEARPPRVVVLNTDHERATVLPVDLARIPTPEEAFFAAVPLASVTPDE